MITLQNDLVEFFLEEHSSGIECCRRGVWTSAGYRSGIFIPKGPWTRCSPTPPSSESATPGNSILCSRLRDSELKMLRKLSTEMLSEMLTENLPIAPSRSLLGLDACGVDISSSLSFYFRKAGFSIDGLKNLGLTYSVNHLKRRPNRVDLSSTTKDRTSPYGLRGLHADNLGSPRVKLSQRSTAYQKILINVGLATRYFCYLEPTIESLFSTLRQSRRKAFKSPVDIEDFSGPLVDWYLSRHPNCLIKRIAMQPGSVVIAPVQNLIHDGCPGSDGEMDLCVQGQCRIQIV